MTSLQLRYLLVFDVFLGGLAIWVATYFGTAAALGVAVGVVLTGLSTAGLIALMGWLLDPDRPARSKGMAGLALVAKLFVVIGLAWVALANGLAPMGLAAGVAVATLATTVGLNLANSSEGGRAAMAEASRRAVAAAGQEIEDKPGESG